MNVDLEKRLNVLKRERTDLQAPSEEGYCDYAASGGSMANVTFYANTESRKLSKTFEDSLGKLIIACDDIK